MDYMPQDCIMLFTSLSPQKATHERAVLGTGGVTDGTGLDPWLAAVRSDLRGNTRHDRGTDRIVTIEATESRSPNNGNVL